MALRAGPLLLLATAALSAGCGDRPADKAAPGATVDISSPQAFHASVIRPGAEEPCFAPIAQRQGNFVGADGPEAAREGGQIILAVDSSGSMRKQVGGETAITAARRAAQAFLEQQAKRAQVGLVVFGHRGDNTPAGKAASCSGIEVPFRPAAANREAIATGIATLEARGWTPLAAALDQARQSFDPSIGGPRIVYVVSDGVETCDGDPVAAARRLHTGEVKAIVNIIGFDVPAKERAALQAVAQAGGGEYLAADNYQQLMLRMQAFKNRHEAWTKNVNEMVSTNHDNISASVKGVNEMQMCAFKLRDDERKLLQDRIDAEAAAGRIDFRFGQAVRRIQQQRDNFIRKRMLAYHRDAVRSNQAAHRSVTNAMNEQNRSNREVTRVDRGETR